MNRNRHVVLLWILAELFLFGFIGGTKAWGQTPNFPCVWRDKATGKVVEDFPYRAEPDPADSKKAFREDTGEHFQREGSVWKNLNLGGISVKSYPYRSEPDPMHPLEAFRPDTGERFYRDCPTGPSTKPPDFPPPEIPPQGEKPENKPIGLPPWVPPWLAKPFGLHPPGAPATTGLGPNVGLAVTSIDPCLVGHWRSEPVGPNMIGVTGGDGILVSFKADGSQHIDYNGMKPFKGGMGDQNFWIGTADGHITTSNGAASIKSIESANVEHRYIGANGITSSNPLKGGLGPAALGNNRMDPSYQCNEAQLTYKDPGRIFVFLRLDENGVPLKGKPSATSAPTAPAGTGLAPPGVPDSLRKECEPEYSRAMAEADEKARDAANAHHAAETFRSNGMNTKKTAQADRQLAEQARGTMLKAIANGDKKAEADAKEWVEKYTERAKFEEGSAEYNLQQAASTEQRAQSLDQEAQAIRKDAVQDCLQKTGGK